MGKIARYGPRYKGGVDFIKMNFVYDERSAKKSMCKNRDVRNDECAYAVMEGIFVKTQRQKKDSVRGARHTTIVIAFWKQSKLVLVKKMPPTWGSINLKENQKWCIERNGSVTYDGSSPN